MKVERGNGGFVPIVITLETIEEAELLWHRLNCATTQPFDAYKREGGIVTLFDYYSMWEALNDVFDARKKI